jgi:hypothetical protein
MIEPRQKAKELYDTYSKNTNIPVEFALIDVKKELDNNDPDGTHGMWIKHTYWREVEKCLKSMQ